MQCRFHSGNNKITRKQIHWLDRQVGMSRYGVTAATMFKPAPLMHAIYQDRMMLYWLVPAANGRAAMDDVLGMLNKMVPNFEKLGGKVVVALHAREMTIDARAGRWRDDAAAMLPEVMTLASREGSAGVTIAASTQFWQCSSAPVAANLPEPLRVRGFTSEVTEQ